MRSTTSNIKPRLKGWSPSFARLIVLACSLLLWPAAPLRAEVSIPALVEPVIDQGAFFTSDERATIEGDIRSLFDSGGPQMAVWTLPDLGGEDIAGLSIRAVDLWKLGRKDKDDGLLLMIARAERRTRLEVGRGLEGVIPDVLAHRLLDDRLKPQLRAGRPAQGVLDLIAGVRELVGDPEKARREADQATQDAQGGTIPPHVLFLLIVFFIFFALPLIRRGFLGGGVPFPGTRPGGSWRGGGGDPPSDDWSGGGGRFSGGGSNGDW